jgi:hypothetical protein
MEQHRIPKKVYWEAVLEEEDQWEDHEIDGKMSYRGIQPTCSGFGTGRLQREMRRSGGRRLGRPRPKNWPKHHRITDFLLYFIILCQFNFKQGGFVLDVLI